MSFTVYKSSAGSGKTFTLVKEYLKLVLSEPEKFRHILAITFTNKAANEMKQRIVDTLEDFERFGQDELKGAAAFMFSEIINETGLQPEQLNQNAGNVLSKILHHYTDFAVCTIDSFTHRVIRNFAFDLNVPLNFEVELDTESILKRVIDMLIGRVGTDENLTRFLVSFTQSKTDDEKNWNIEQDIYSVAKQLLDEESQVHIAKLSKLTLDDFLEINRKIDHYLNAVEKKVIEIASAVWTLIQNNRIPHSAFSRGANGIGKYFENLSIGMIGKLNPNSYVQQTVDEDKWYSTKAQHAEKEAIDSIKKEMLDAFERLMKVRDEELERYIILGEIRKNLYPVAILNEIEKTLVDYKSENAILLISEFNKRIAEVVLNEPVPFVYERLGEKYDHFLIDEFQDTSVLQWLNLLPLIENSLGSDNFNMVVGDAKQAIYRWRNGDVDQFIRLPRIRQQDTGSFTSQREQALIRNFKPETLDKNFRSHAEIINFNYSFFSHVSEYLDDEYKPIYQDVNQSSGSKNPGGFVGIEFFDPDSTQEFDEYNVQNVLKIISDALARNYRYRDIAVLCRSNTNAGLIAARLLSHQIPVVSSESLLLSNSPEVRLIIAVIGFLVNPQDEIAAIGIIDWLIRNQLLKAGFDEALQLAGIGKGTTIDPESHSNLIALFEKLNLKLNITGLVSQGIYEMCEAIIRAFSLDKHTDPFIQFLLDAILEQSRNPAFGPEDFLEWWDDQKDGLSVVVPEQLNAVKILTIHKAKGLEFPVVIYPFAIEKLRKTREKFWADLNDPRLPGLTTTLLNVSQNLGATKYEKEYNREMSKSLLDIVNLLYVALTRASENLFVITKKPPESGSTKSIPVFLKSFLVSTGAWEEDVNKYSFGVVGNRNEVDQPDRGDIKLKRFISTDWRQKVNLSFSSPDVYNEDDDVPSPRELGKLYHSVLSQITTASDLDLVISDYLVNGIIKEDELSAMHAKISDFLAHPDVAPFFNQNLRIKTEKEVLLQDGTLIRPDRLILEDNKVRIVDFKTGKKQEKHMQQMVNYRETLKTMGYSEIECYLLYLNEPDPVISV